VTRVRDATGGVQSAVVIGGTSEIALATLRKLAEARLRRATLAARDAERAEQSARGLQAMGVEVELVRFDARDHDSHERVVEEAFERTGEVDVVIVAHGVLGPAGRDQLEASVETIEVNFTAAVSAIVPAARALERQGHGTLVVLSSVAGERPRASNFVYGSSKAGLDAFAQGLGDQLAGSGVHVLVVRPGFVRTRMTRELREPPLSVEPEDVADAIVAGIRRDAHTIWVPPLMRWVMLALRLLPRPLFRRLRI
jgi:decaprenylphospho-beta-D-erythro-pentofuranosid-2-ulose 2-reductase